MSNNTFTTRQAAAEKGLAALAAGAVEGTHLLTQTGRRLGVQLCVWLLEPKRSVAALTLN